MAWRPHEYLIKGEVDNTVLGKVTGWLQFLCMDENVSLDLQGNFHRDIRGTKIVLRNEDDIRKEARTYMRGFCLTQTGEVGDMTAGLYPQDYVDYPYLEWYSEENGRVVLELEPHQLEMIGTPIPTIESDPINRTDQDEKMAAFLGAMLKSTPVLGNIVLQGNAIPSDPEFPFWVNINNNIVGEAKEVEHTDDECSFAFVRLFGMEQLAEYGSIPTSHLKKKPR